MVEIWKDIEGYEGHYKVSNLGRIKSLIKWNGNRYVKCERILKPYRQKSIKNYYRSVIKLKKYGVSKDCKVHRLVAKAFIDNHNNYPMINHIDGNPLNNCVENLEWCTQKENVKHAIDTGLRSVYKISENQLYKLYVTDKKSAKDIAKELGITRQMVYFRLKKYGIKRRKSSDYKKYNIPLDKMLQDFRMGFKNKEIQKKYKCSKEIVATRKHQFKKEGLI